METFVGFVRGDRDRRAARSVGRVLAAAAAHLLSAGGFAGDGAEDRLRAGLHQLVGPGFHAEDLRGHPRLLLPDHAQRHPRVQLVERRSRRASAARPAPDRCAPSSRCGCRRRCRNSSSASRARRSTPRSARRSRNGSAPTPASASTSSRRSAIPHGHCLRRHLHAGGRWACSCSGMVILAERLLIPWHVSQRAPVAGL